MKHMRLRVALQEGFALPTILIASVIMLTILTSAVTAVSSMSTSIEAHYHNQLAREAAESGMARATDCLKQSSTGTPQWTDMKPLRPNTDCSGNILTDKSQYITESGNVRTSFRVGRPSTGSSDATRISATGDIGLVRSSDANTIWRAYTQTITQDARYQSQPKIAGGAGWQDNGHLAAVLTTDQQLYAFGANSMGQINDLSSPANVLFPEKLALPSGVSSVTAVETSGQGASIMCILANTAQVYCRGAAGAAENGLMPSIVGWQRFGLPAGVSATSMSIDGDGADAMCVLGSDGQGYCAGQSYYGSLGTGVATNTVYKINNPQKFRIDIPVPGATLTKIYAGSTVTCGITNAADLYCAGRNDVGQIAGPSTSGQSNGVYNTPTRYPIPGARKVKDVLVSYHDGTTPVVHVMGTDGTIWSSGSYANGDLGHSTTTGSTGATQSPIPFTTGQKNYAAGSELWNAQSGRCLDNNANQSGDGNIIHLWDCGGANSGPQTWYYNDRQQLTNFGTGKCLDVPTGGGSGTAVHLWTCHGGTEQRFELIGGISGSVVRHITSGLCLDARSGGTANGTIVQVYTCNGTPSQSFTRWSGIMAWQGMLTGHGHFCGLRTDLWSGMWCAGSNSYGQLLNWASAGGSFLGQCVSTPSGGYNYFNVNLPNGEKVDIAKLSDEWRQQYLTTMVISNTGKVYGAGRDPYGMFGDGAVSSANNYQNCVTSEFQLPPGVTAMDMSARDEFTAYVLGSDGRIYAAGRNNNGQIGDGTTTDRLVPVEVKIPRQRTNY